MASRKINLNGETVPFTIFIAGTQGNPNISIDYDTLPGWPQSVVVTGIDDETIWQQHMIEAFVQCGADITKIVIETI